MNLRNQMFSLSNSLKAYAGRLDALRTAEIWTRKRLAEEAFIDSIMSDPALRAGYADVFDQIAEIQAEKAELAELYGAFRLITSGTGSPALVRRAILTASMLDARRRGAATQADSAAARIADIDDLPPALEHALLAIQLGDFIRYLGAEHDITRTALQGMTAEEAATALLEASALAEQATTREALRRGGIEQDPAVQLGLELLPLLDEFGDEWNRLSALEAELAAELGRARFEVYGTDVPPDATSSPRITDGRVLPYEYNGTRAPVYTTLFGLYDHYFSYGEDSEWDLPQRWLPAPPELDLGTPLNFISTADTYGGNSGSPAITPDIQMVGLNFDRNIEGLSRDFIYLPERGRNMMVDVRAITEALDHVYDADRIVEELITGRLIERESEANEGVR